MSYIKRILQVLNKPIKDGEVKWTFKKYREVVCGWEIGFNVPSGSSYEKAVECLPALEATCGHEIEIDKYKGLIVVRIIEKDWPFPMRFDPKDLRADKLLMGYNRLLEPVYHPLNVHILEGGASGAGKTDWQRWIAYQLLRQGYDVYICDMKGYSFDPFEGLVTVADDLKSSEKILSKMVKELERRKAVIQSKEFGNREETIATFRPIVVIIDEAADLSPTQYTNGTTDKNLAYSCDRAISFIGRKGREPKVFCIYGTQRPDMKTINKQFKDNVEASIAFRCKDHFASQIIIDRPGAEKIDPKDKGRCIYSHGKDTLLQVPYIGGDKEWNKLLAPIKKGTIVEHGNSKRTNKERTTVDGSYQSADSNNTSAKYTLLEQRKPIEKSQSTAAGINEGKVNRVLLAQKRESVEADTKGIIDDGWL